MKPFFEPKLGSKLRFLPPVLNQESAITRSNVTLDQMDQVIGKALFTQADIILTINRSKKPLISYPIPVIKGLGKGQINTFLAPSGIGKSTYMERQIKLYELTRKLKTINKNLREFFLPYSIENNPKKKGNITSCVNCYYIANKVAITINLFKFNKTLFPRTSTTTLVKDFSEVITMLLEKNVELVYAYHFYLLDGNEVIYNPITKIVTTGGMVKVTNNYT